LIEEEDQQEKTVTATITENPPAAEKKVDATAPKTDLTQGGQGEDKGGKQPEKKNGKRPDYIGPVTYKAIPGKKGGKAYIIHVAITPDDEQLTTFNADHGAIIQEADQKKRRVNIWIEINGTFKNIADIELVREVEDTDKGKEELPL
jgi:hypothetical protein